MDHGGQSGGDWWRTRCQMGGVCLVIVWLLFYYFIALLFFCFSGSLLPCFFICFHYFISLFIVQRDERSCGTCARVAKECQYERKYRKPHTNASEVDLKQFGFQDEQPIPPATVFFLLVRTSAVQPHGWHEESIKWCLLLRMEVEGGSEQGPRSLRWVWLVSGIKEALSV
ncbi:VID27 cytoplasmic protein [Colletotrichum scovillei]|uniref:VID27 cytoplasmic protein n=1 Tax=Colletotrichum scovillei TaxID=1209932 RepID=UPI0015C3CBFD|nr:VID27 cytoplasmic protein [Colletotrichum scovillei]KAF4772796.1 VID27 cytoplasmic protein [Colletotrichum scovillei]